MQPKRFNVRVYGILIHEGQLLVNEELIRGKYIIKFPGGGLNYGEGTIDCLKREFKEELNLDIEVKGHYYTTNFFQHSAYDDSQVISIYYMITAPQLPDSFINTEPNERTYWIPMTEVSADSFTLAIDKIVGGMLRQGSL